MATENLLGGLDVFLPYVRDYVQTFMGKSITTWDWKEHLFDYFGKHGTKAQVDALNTVDWNVGHWSFSRAPFIETGF